MSPSLLNVPLVLLLQVLLEIFPHPPFELEKKSKLISINQLKKFLFTNKLKPEVLHSIVVPPQTALITTSLTNVFLSVKIKVWLKREKNWRKNLEKKCFNITMVILILLKLFEIQEFEVHQIVKILLVVKVKHLLVIIIKIKITILVSSMKKVLKKLQKHIIMLFVKNLFQLGVYLVFVIVVKVKDEIILM